MYSSLVDFQEAGVASTERKIKSGEWKIPDLATKAVRRAYKKALQNGSSVYVTVQDAGWRGVVEVFPNGRRERIKLVSPPKSVSVGARRKLEFLGSSVHVM